MEIFKKHLQADEFRFYVSIFPAVSQKNQELKEKNYGLFSSFQKRNNPKEKYHETKIE